MGKRILVLYATREGQARRIAEHIGSELSSHGFAAEIHNAAMVPESFALSPFDTAILVASVHVGKHEPEMVTFVKSHRSDLERIQAIFLSVSGAEASAENPTASPASREKAAANVKAMIEAFLKETGWRPAHLLPVAGALLYRNYNPLMRFIIRLIAKSEGQNIDTSRNTEYTDWKSLDHFLDEWMAEIGPPAESIPQTGETSITGA